MEYCNLPPIPPIEFTYQDKVQKPVLPYWYVECPVLEPEDEGLPQLEKEPTEEDLYPISKESIDEIKFSEGFVAYAYWDHSQYSIGYGSGTYPNGTRVQAGDVISQAEGEEMLKHLLDYYIKEVSSIVTVELNRHQLGALVSLAYNIGIGAFERSTLVRLLNQGNYTGAANEFQRWVYAGGSRNSGLASRRLRERKLFETIEADVNVIN